jgi:hypothetical protein
VRYLGGNGGRPHQLGYGAHRRAHGSFVGSGGRLSLCRAGNGTGGCQLTLEPLHSLPQHRHRLFADSTGGDWGARGLGILKLVAQGFGQLCLLVQLGAQLLRLPPPAGQKPVQTQRPPYATAFLLTRSVASLWLWVSETDLSSRSSACSR